MRHTAAAAALRARWDRALLLLGYAAALRRRELVALNVGDLADGHRGLSVFIKRSKTDQEGHGDVVGVAPSTISTLAPIDRQRNVRTGLQRATFGEVVTVEITNYAPVQE